jgi:hypothetical protein
MRKTLLCLLLFCSWSAYAQYRPGFEVFGGYSNLNSDANGWHASAALDLTRWIGALADFSGYYATSTRRLPVNLGTETVHGQAHAYFFGPQVSWRTRRITLSGHVLGGTVRVSAGLAGLNLSAAENETTWAAGGNVDVRIVRFLAVRVIQGDYIPTHFANQDQQNGRVSAGLVFVLDPR